LVYSRKRSIATANRAQSAIGGTLEIVLSGMANNALGGGAERGLGPEAATLGNALDGAEETVEPWISRCKAHHVAHPGILEFVKLQVGTQTPAHHLFARPQTQVIVDLLIVKLAIDGSSLQQIVKPVTLNI